MRITAGNRLGWAPMRPRRDGRTDAPMGLDLRTVAMVCAIITLLLAALIRLARDRYPAKWRPSLEHWNRALFVLPVGWTLLCFREQLPPTLGVAAANLLLFYGFGELALATARFAGWRGPQRLTWLLVGVGVLASFTYTYVVDSYVMRILLGSPVIALLFWQIARPLMPSFQNDGALSHRITATVFLAGAALMVVRLFWEAIPTLRGSGVFEFTPMQAVVLTYLPIAPLIATYGFLLMCNDRMNEELEQLATIDPLTGAWNRRAFLEQCERALSLDRRNRRPSALLLADADHFKRVNDTYGHEAGDAVLRELVRRMNDILRSEDIVGRLGGEEFVALLPGTDEEGATQVAERIRAAIEGENFLCRGEEIPITISIGVAEREPGEADIEALTKRGDTAMYAAKRAGRNRVVASTSLKTATAA